MRVDTREKMRLISTRLKESGTRARSRFSLGLVNFLALLVCCLVLRVVLFCVFKPTPVSAADVLKAFAIGFHFDVFIALTLTLPLIFWLAIIPDRLFRFWAHRRFFKGVFFFFWFVQVFLFFAEYYFFEEFKSRFNTVAVDYLWYPHETFVNIWDTYPVGIVLGTCGVFAAVLLVVVHKLTKPLWEVPTRAGIRLLHFLGALVLWVALRFSISGSEARFSNERVINEIASNGAYAFVSAAWSRNLDYAAFYVTMPREVAYQRSRRLLTETNATFVSTVAANGPADATVDTNSLQRSIAGSLDKPKYNVVIMLEESLGSEFWGCLGRTNTLTPELDRLAMQEGMLFTNIYASGNRTVRGFEGVLSSFPPLPGDSIVKRDRSENVETIARILQRDGYSTIFLYGGRGLFDGMRSFAMNNGYDKFIEQKNFENPTFTTIWGVCNEDLYDRAIQEFRTLEASGRPFFATVLSVSNHKPFTYPKGRIPEDPDRRTRANAVKYTDYALGRYFKMLKNESFYPKTIFVVIADHGARVYGSQDIPIFSYEIPLLVIGPAVVKQPCQLPQLGCSLDVSPTILGLLGRPYQTMFFGRDLLNSSPDGGRVLINHNRDIGMFRDDRMVVLGINKLVEFYHGNPKHEELRRIKDPDATDLELERDATAIYQVADDLYMHRKYRVQFQASP
jgi:phosphoglycerol transferase MdoB-like AlkP superfamily enzyme